MAEFPKDKCYAGVHIENMSDIESKLTRRHSAVRVFKKSFPTLLDDAVKAREAQGRLPVLSWRIDGTWADAANGSMDNWFIRQRQDFRDTGINAIGCPTPEPDSRDEAGRYGRYQSMEHPGMDGRNADDFKNMVDHFQDLLDEGPGTPNFRLATVTTGGNITTDWARRYFSPRAHYIGSDPYNWCPESGHGAGLQSFADIVRPLRQVTKDMKKPAILAEMACWFKPDDPSFRANWIRDIAAEAAEFTRLKVICWFSKKVECDFRLEEQRESLDAWDESVLGNPNFQSL